MSWNDNKNWFQLSILFPVPTSQGIYTSDNIKYE